MIEIKNQELLIKLLELKDFMKKFNITTKSKEYKKAFEVYVDLQHFDFENARNRIVENNLLDLKEYIIFQYIYEIFDLDKQHEILSLSYVLNKIFEELNLK